MKVDVSNGVMVCVCDGVTPPPPQEQLPEADGSADHPAEHQGVLHPGSQLTADTDLLRAV